MKKPSGKEIMELLVKLLAEQENVKITYKIEGAGNEK